MPLALKATIIVTAGVIVGEPIPEATRSWQFTNIDIEEAQKGKQYAYLDGLGAAYNYAATLQNPSRYNWVRLEWIWL